MIVGNDGLHLDASADQEIDQDRFDLRLSGLEVVSTNENLLFLSKLKHSRNKGVLRRTIDVRRALEDTRDRENSRRGDLRLSALNSCKQVLRSVVHACLNLGKSLGVGSPQNNHFVQVVGRLEVTNVLPDLVKLLLFASFQNIGSSSGLVGSDEVGEIDRRKRSQFLHLVVYLSLQVVIKNLCVLHGVTQRSAADVPSPDDQVIGVHHRQKILERDVHVFSAIIVPDSDGGGLSKRTEVVGTNLSLLVVPGDAMPVGDDTCRNRGPIVSSPSHKHCTHPRDYAISLELKVLCLRHHNSLAIAVLHQSGLISVCSIDCIISVLDFVAFDFEWAIKE
mmetsp:Transcript_24560/g.55438  ORF Transcript_24560/g.55438 Transcript_24560/m.55438 type:complete len:335 (-) Transcript_24560:31-1035(-)